MNSLRLQNCRGATHCVYGLCSVLLSRLAMCSVAAIFSAVATSCLGAVVPIGPIPYLSAADSPLLADPTLDVVLEDFEDGLFNVPGVTTQTVEDIGSFFEPFVNDGRGIVVGPSPDTDSVDADDGTIDGLGTGGHAFRSTAILGLPTIPTLFGNFIDFIFQPNSNGTLPNAFGFVWTDGEPGPNPDLEIGVVEIDSFGTRIIHPFAFYGFGGDNEFDGGTHEDRFFGFVSNNELESISISFSFFGLDEFDSGFGRQLFFEMDHLQLGYSRVPEPNSMALITICALLVLSKSNFHPGSQTISDATRILKI